MASLVATPSSSSFLNPLSQPRQGILLNRNDVIPTTTPKLSPINLPAPLPRSNSNSSSNSSDASPSDSPPRKIRFAPLPDPRRAALATESGDPSAAPAESQDPVPALLLTPAGELIALTPVTSISGDSTINGSTINGDDSDPRAEPGSGSDLRSGAKKKKSKKWGKRLFGPLLKATPSSSKDEAPALAYDSSHSHGTNPQELGFPLGRRTSTGSTEPFGRGRPSLIGSPLTLTRSAEGGGTAPVRQQRMLNGRVYGARQSLPNTTTQEPAFVEWGYGGMGAVNSSGGSQYARLQSSNKLSLGTEASTAEEDDGSGMAWVMKRRAAREEKARKEKEEAERAKEASTEAAEPTVAQTTIEVKPQKSDGEDGEMRPETPKAVANRPPILPPSRRSSEGRPPDVASPTSLMSDHEEHHNVKTVSIPSAHPRPNHTRSQSIGSLKERERERVALPASPPGSERESEPGSTTEDDDEEEGDTSEMEAEEDIEEEERKTALCAGLEKVSRHT